MKISILLGSIRQERQSHRLAYYIKDQITEMGATVNLIDLKSYPLPICGTVISNEEKERVGEISACLKGAQAVIIVTPEYHSSISAALKNVLEYCGTNLTGKVVGIASASATKFGGLHASNNLQITLLNLGAYPATRRLLMPEIHLAFNEENKPLQDESRAQVEKFLNELWSYAGLMESKVLRTGQGKTDLHKQ